MTITQLTYFCAVCRYGSISKAAEELFISHPTVSVAIKSLENEFSLQLFKRSGNRVSLTRDGEAFYKKALDILQRCDEMYADFSNRPESSYRVHTGVPPIRSTVLFPSLLEDFHKKYSIPVVLHEYSSRRSLEKLQEGSLDCCLVNVEDSVLSGYNRAILMNDHFIFLVSKKSPLSSRKSITAEDLKDYPLILQSSDSALNTPVTQAFSSTGITPHILLYSSQLTTILNFVKKNLGGAFLYSSMISGPKNVGNSLLQDDSAFCTIPFLPEIQNTFALVWPKGGYINRNVKTWISFVKKTLTID
ncbi:MAG: LysR family transcriptional regulator [Eubacterium sp.]